MRVITETELRDQYKQGEFTSFQLPAGARLTPSAQQFISERRITLLPDAIKEQEAKSQRPVRRNLGYEVQATGETISEKPEHMTHIQGNNLVLKNHERIKFRGKLDSLEASLLHVILEAEQQGLQDLSIDLTDLLNYTRQMMRADVLGEPLEPLIYHGLNPGEIRERSHHPNQFYGVPHIFPQPNMGRLMVLLNLLRTQSRELELAAMDAFYGQNDFAGRPDILQSLNRLSSLIYIMMVQLRAGQYKFGS